MASIDSVDWHCQGDFPPDLPSDHAGTHIGMYLAWIIRRDLGSAELRRLAGEMIPAVHHRRITGRTLLLTALDGKLFPRLLNPDAREFTRSYYEANAYFADYDRVLGGDLPSLYHVEDSWENYDRLEPVLDQRWRAWEATRAGGVD